jgi:hypothetical protein
VPPNGIELCLCQGHCSGRARRHFTNVRGDRKGAKFPACDGSIEAVFAIRRIATDRQRQEDQVAALAGRMIYMGTQGAVYKAEQKVLFCRPPDITLRGGIKVQ